MEMTAQTSVGRVVVAFYGHGTLHITLFGDDGWAVKEGEWGDAEVDRGLFYVAGVPEDEATRLGRQIDGEYKARGGKATGRWEGARDRGLAGIVVLLAVLAIFVIGCVSIVRWIV